MELVSVAILLGDPVLVGVVGNISACHADARGSIPRRGAFFTPEGLASQGSGSIPQGLLLRLLQAFLRPVYSS